MIDFLLYVYSFILAILYTLGIVKEEFKQSDSVAIVTALVLHLPYLYIYLWKDSERLIYAVFTQGIVILVPIYLYISLDRANADFFSILVLTAGLAAPTLTLFSRQYFQSCPRGLSWLMCRPKQETLALIKPDGMQHQTEIIQLLKQTGFDIIDDIETRLSPQLVATWYADKLEKPYYPDLEKYMTSGPVHVLRLSRRKGIKKLREIIGPTDAELARAKYKDTIRGRFGTDIQQNAIHASDSKKSAKKEISLFWDEKGNAKGSITAKRGGKEIRYHQDATQKKLDLIWKSVQSMRKEDEELLKMENSIFEQVAAMNIDACSSCPATIETVTHKSHYIPSVILSLVIIVLFVWNAYSERKQRRELTKELNKIQNKLESLNESQSSSRTKAE